MAELVRESDVRFGIGFFMLFQQDLFDLNGLFNFSDLNTFTHNIPIEWVESALKLSSSATIRRRRLPADQVLWPVLGMAIFRDEPVEWLFRQTGQHWGHARYPDDQWQGLQVFAVDGAEHFGSGNTSTQRQTPFPMLRLVALMNVRSHILVDAQISPYRRGEIPLASKFLNQIPDHSITLFDKGFWSADLLLSLSMQVQGRHWLIPERKNLKSEVIETYAEGDVRIRMKVSPQARKNNPMLPEYWEVRQVSYAVGKGRIKTVLTSLPADQYPAKDIARLYQERWEIELGFRDIKSSMQHNAITLRSKTVELVYQELWGLLLTYNIIRREAAFAAVAFGRSPSDTRFKPVCQYMANANPLSGTGRRLSELRTGIGSLFLERRSRPTTPRTVKMSKTRYPVDCNAALLK